MTTTTDNFLKEKEYRQPIRTRMSEFGDDEAAKTMYVLLLKDAVDTEQVLTVDDQVVVLHRGESIFGRFAYAKKMGLKKSESLRCTRILSRLVKTHNKVNIRALNRCTVVTIKDYDYEIIMKWRPDEAVKTSKSLFTNNKMNNRQSEERVDVTTQNNNEENEMLEMLYKKIEDLNKIEQTIVLLFLEGFNYKEIALITGFTENNIGVKMSRIKNRLKELIEDE